MRRGMKGALIGGACSIMVSAAGYGGYTLLQGTSNGKPTGDAASALAAAPSRKIITALSAAEVAHTASDFLAAWSSGDVRKAAGLTDNAAQAADRLAAFRTQFHATSIALTSRPARGTTVPFLVNARYRYNGQQSSWRYDSALRVARDSSGRAVVKWAPSVLYPTLSAGQTLGIDHTPAPALRILDRHGKVLTAAEFPSLGPVLGQLQAAYGTATGGSPGTEIRVKGAGGKPGAVLHQLSHGKAGRPLPTTVDANLQAAAERAVKTKGPDASTVVMQPSTGAILAIANQPAAGYDKAMSGTYAPGSTFKLITASAALETGKVAPDKPLNCPKNYQYGSQNFHNVNNFSLQNATMAQDFAQSCNTAFISTATFMPDAAVSNEAHDVFGIGLNWTVGVPAYSGSVPAAAGSLKAMSYIGQGKDLMSPLAMASVVSTVRAAGFHQPFIVSPSVDGRTLAKAPRQLSASVATQVRSMMRLTAQSGTAAPAMAGLSGDIGAKTGTAEVDGQSKPNSWFVAYRGDVAAAAIVPNSGEGYKFAGPIVAATLKAVS
ncbi:penicillin-binding protein [Actinacidiphila oryziradicis]|uniref:Penicillin-binding protein n=2 Tax=Actinacidiphila oryziradicis TaxID=2571141 RepID=A0A4U0T898_9ACTN|nr:penicillin-binding protein [Actinacidiphila oryziradicis]